MIWAYPVDKKGADDEQWVADRIVADLNAAGLQRCKIAFKSDQEPSIVDVQNDVMRRRNKQGLNTSMQNSPVGDSDNNGRIEKAIREREGVARTLRFAFEERIGKEIDLAHPIIPWL